MNDRHYDDDQIFALLFDRDQMADADAADAHLDSCVQCREIRESIEMLTAALADERVWSEESLPGRAPEKRVAAAVELASRLEEEDEQAASHLRRLIDLSINDLRLAILSDHLATLGFVRKLIEHIRSTLERKPARALALAGLALEIGDLIDRTLYPASTVDQVLGSVWKERASALRFLGRFQEGLAALDKAEEIFARTTAPGLQLAIVDFARSMIFRELKRDQEALTLVRSSGRAFLEMGDIKRHTQARYAEGVIIFERGEIAAARDVFQELLKPVQSLNDVETLARLFHALGRCFAELGDPDTAATYLLQAMATYDDLGMDTEKIRIRAALGKMLLASGRTAEGLDRLSQAEREFERLEMQHDAALVALDVVDGLLTLGRGLEAVSICRHLIEVFTESGATSGAVTALSYLREALATGKATPEVVGHIRHYFLQIPEQPQLLFLPPPS
ncbi:MAG TPA: hypothetical protein VMT00_14710 [Thermoanaerobaculia bacterium]|nr:hypothetical protein [Thermoanaerobaculia bacterium]